MRGLYPYPGLDRDRLLALVTGLLGAALALASGFLPVHQDVARVQWTPGADYQSVTAPLISGRPLDVDVSIPCRSAAEAPDETVLVSTLPRHAPGRSADGLVVQRGRTAAGVPSVEVVVRNLTLLSVPVATLRAPGCRELHIRAETGIMSAEALGVTSGDVAGGAGPGDGPGGQAPDPDTPLRAALPGTLRPQVVGLFTDLDPATSPRALQGAHAELTVDSRFSSSPTALKTVLVLVGVLATCASLYFLHRLDRIDGRGDRRFVAQHWTRPAPVDGVVIGVLALWHLVGANTSDDGYLLTMARAAGPSGYMANYYRWLGSPESPVGWYYEILKAFAEVSTASPWMRLPTLACGIASWLIISREVVPRFGRLARRWQRAQWTGAAVFLTFWMAFDNGLRPEPVIALGVLLTWSLVERSVATGRLLPAAAAVGVAAFSVGTGPTGLMCVAALAAGARPILAATVRRARVVGWLPLLAPVLAVGLALLYTVFADQTYAAVAEATRIRTSLGPSLPWYGEKERWIALFSVTADGGVARRFPILIMFLCLGVVGAVMLRRGRVPGAATGPAGRLLGVIGGSLLLLVFTPTKWTHHLGVFAGLAGALAVLAVIALRTRAIALARNRWLFGAALALVVALSTATDNKWWYVSAYGIPFSDSFPTIAGVQVNLLAFLACLGCLGVAGLVHVGLGPRRVTDALAGSVARRAGLSLPRWLRPAPHTPAALTAHARTHRGPVNPLTVVAFALVTFQVASAMAAVVGQAPAYTVGRANTRALLGHPCSLADAVLVEENSNDGVLRPIGATPANALGAGGSEGFGPNGVPDSLTADDTEATADSDGSDKTDTSNSGGAGGGASAAAGSTSGGSASGGSGSGSGPAHGPETVNGSSVALPFGLDPRTTSVLGSYRRGPQVAAQLTSAWYELPARSAARPLLVMAAAGSPGDIRVEYGRAGKVGQYGPGDFEVLGALPPIDLGPAPDWRNLRIPLERIPAEAEAVRIVAADGNLDPDWWLAVTPPRNPRLRTLEEVVGRTDPVLIDWVVGLAFPCQRPVSHRDGVAEIPRYRILADRESSTAANWWQSAAGGGPLLWTTPLLRPVTVPTYLDHDWSRDWGSLQRFTPRDPDAVPATLEVSRRTDWGWHDPGPLQ